MDLSLRSVGIDAFVLLFLIAEATTLSCDLSQLGIDDKTRAKNKT
jgi:hypothetical protein